MEINDIREYLRREPDVLESIKNIMNYRNLRTEQAYYAKLAYEYDNQFKIGRNNVCKTVRQAGEFDRSFWKDRLYELDKNRRNTHNKALAGFTSMVNKGRLYGFPKIYTGKVLTADEIDKHGNPDIREKMTDVMFEMLFTIEDSVIEQEHEKIQADKDILGLRKEMRAFNREYGVVQSMRKDEDRHEDGGIIFEHDLSSIFDNIFENGKESL